MKLLLPGIYEFFHSAKRYIALVINLYEEKSCQKSAASLTYMTLFAIVPMITVIYSMFSIIPAFQAFGDQFQAILFAYILPNSEQTVVQYIHDFSTQARNLTAFGVAFLIVSAYFMLKNIEQNFNFIWNVPRERRGVSNFLLYWAILSLGPLLLGLALVMKTYLISLRLFVGHYDTYDILEPLFRWTPLLLTSAAFTLLFVAVPNCKVRISHAAIGGVLTMVAFEISKQLFGWVVTHSSLNLIYGAFAVVPLFLLWINLTWMLILGGAVCVRSISLYQIHLKDRGYPDFFGCLLVLWQFHLASFKGAQVSNTQLLHLGLSTDQWQRLVEALLNNNVICANQQNGFVLSRDLAHLTLNDIRQFLGSHKRLPADTSHLRDLPWFGNARQLLGHLDDIETDKLTISVESFFEGRSALTVMDKKISL
ncbi:MAG TPA: YihY family inner membrane protein [Cellvibrio sp.]|nr:YihY family inner membrane protein [Cellvibrio sp.]